MSAVLHLLVPVAFFPKLRNFSNFALVLCHCLGLSLHLRTIERLQSPLEQFHPKVVPQVKNLFFKAFKDLHVSRVPKNLILFPKAASPGPGNVLSCGI
jgi:hypothetical protein